MSAKLFEKKEFEKLDNEHNNFENIIEIKSDLANKSNQESHEEEANRDKEVNVNISIINQSNINENDISQDQGNASMINASANQSLNQSVASCLICYEKLPDSVLMECGHGGTLKFQLNNVVF